MMCAFQFFLTWSSLLLDLGPALRLPGPWVLSMVFCTLEKRAPSYKALAPCVKCLLNNRFKSSLLIPIRGAPKTPSSKPFTVVYRHSPFPTLDLF